jgi:3-oxo-5alpha-steroid 4-dehydrogenase
MAACGPDPDEEKIARYSAESLGHFDWLVARGVPFDPSFCPDTSMAPNGTEGLVFSGGEDAYPFSELATPAPRGHLAKTKRSTGWLLMQHLAAAATDAGARVSLDTRVDRLVVDAGRVVGVQGQRFGQTVSLRARRGAVLTAGGFIYNDDMLRQHCPPLVRGTWKVGTEGDDGRGIRMAQAIGASVRNMYAGEVSLPITPPRTLIHGILVNGQGQRFINEDTYMGRVGQSLSTSRTARCTSSSTKLPTR